MLDLNAALVHDWLSERGGAETLLGALLEIFPQAPIYTLVYRPEVFSGTLIHKRQVRPSFIDRLPGARKRYRSYLPLMPLAVEQFDLRKYQLIFSTSDAVAHGVLLSPDQLHINYIFTPMRYAWRLYHQYLAAAGLKSGIRSSVVRLMLHYLRLWDFAASARVDHFIAPSKWIARDVWRVYRRQADVIYPPVLVDEFNPTRKREDFYIIVSRLVPYKRLPMIVQTFNELGLPLVIVGEGPEIGALRKMAGPRVQILGWRPRSEVIHLLERARAFVHAAEEDFGIAVVEALAAGCPVVAYRRGGVLETVTDEVSGIFFDEPESASLKAAVLRIEGREIEFDPSSLHASVEKFRVERFQAEIEDFVRQAWDLHTGARD